MGNCIFKEKTPFEHFGIMIDCSRDAVMKPAALKKMIDILEKLGYNMLMLYTEDTYEVKNQPYFGHLRGRFTKEELQDLDAYAKAHGVELVPCIQTLAHFNALLHWRTYAPMFDCNDILLPGDERVYQLIDDIFASLAESFSSRMVNIGMDEAEMVGLGKYLKEHGYCNRTDILVEHVKRVSEIAAKYGFTAAMWSDMFFKLAADSWGKESTDIDASIGKMIPDNVRLIYWDYYSTEKKHYDTWIEGHEKLKPGCLFAGGIWTWNGFVPENSYSIEAGKVATQSCFEHKVKDVFYTMWGDNGGECSRFAILPGLFYNACIGHGINEEAEMKALFKETFGIAFDDYMLLDLPGTAHDERSHADPDKYMLYCDCFMGKFDSIVRKGAGAEYGEAAKKLAPFAKNPEFGTVFGYIKALCEVLEVKYELGVRTREAYLSGDKAAVKTIAADYDVLLERLDAFYEVYRKQWMEENKPQGFEVHDARIGALIQRVKSCKRRLIEYVDGTIERIEELEEPVLDFQGREMPLAEEDKKAIGYNSWSRAITASIM